MARWLRFYWVVPVVVLVSILQYGGLAFESALKGNVVLWQVDTGELEGAGLFRYLKDGFLVVLGAAWPLWVNNNGLPRGVAKLISGYLLWITAIVAIGLVGIFLEYSPPFFLLAGFRWIMLLHASFGIFLTMKSYPSRGRGQALVVYVLMAIATCDLFLIALQFQSGQAAHGLTLGQSRLTGLFSNAGVAGFFGLAIALIGLQMDGASTRARLFLSAAALVICLSSGTRSMIMGTFAILVLQVIDQLDATRARRLQLALKTIFFPLLAAGVWVGYSWMIDAVDRGGILEAQLAGGGRISNFLGMTEVLSTADIGEFLFGRGLGVGTNTAYGMLVAAGQSPADYRFNWLVDNAFLTLFFQTGLLGSIIFWAGVARFFVWVRPLHVGRFRRRHTLVAILVFVVLWAGNPMEHYLLMMAFAISLGCSYWGSVAERRTQNRRFLAVGPVRSDLEVHT